MHCGSYPDITRPQITETGASYIFFMLFHVMVTMVGLSCVTSFFITHLSARLEEELEVRGCVCTILTTFIA